MAGKKTAPPRGLEQMTVVEVAERPWALAFWLSKSCKVFRELAGVKAGCDRKDLYAREAAACGKVVAAISHARTLAKTAPWLDDLVNGVRTGADAYAGLFAKLMADPRLEPLGVAGDGGGAGGDGWQATCTRAANVCDALELAVGVATAEMGWVPRKAPVGLSLRDVLLRAGDVAAGCDAACGGAGVAAAVKGLAERTADELFGLMYPWILEERPLCDGGVATRWSRGPRTQAELARVAMMDSLHGALLSVAGGKVAPDTGDAIRGLLARLAAYADKDATDTLRRVSNGYTPAKLADLLKLSTDTVRKYAKAAGIPLPGRGQWDYLYSMADCERIAVEIIGTSRSEEMRRNAGQALATLRGGGEKGRNGIRN